MALSNTVLASTLQRRSKGWLNGVCSQIPFWFWMRRAKRYVSKDGGTQLEWNLEYALNEGDPSYDHMDTIQMEERDDVVTPVANWKHYAFPIVISGPQKRINSGMRVFNLLAQKEQNAKESLQQKWNEYVYEDGTGNSSKRITGLKAIISATPTSGNLYGLSRSTYVPLQNYEKDSSGVSYNLSTGKHTMLVDMEDLRIKCGRLKTGGAGGRYPDLILCTEGYFKLYSEILQSAGGLRFIKQDVADAGFDNLAFHNATLMHDEDMPADAGGDEQAYFINSNFMELAYHPDANVSMSEMDRLESVDAFGALVLWMGEILCNLPRKHGLHHGIAAVDVT